MKFSEVSALILSEGFKFLFKFINKAQGTFSDDAGNWTFCSEFDMKSEISRVFTPDETAR